MPHCTRRAPPARPVASGPAASTPPHVRQAVLNLVWDKLLPAMHSPSPLPADDAAADQLEQSLKALTLRSVTGAASPAADVTGRKYVFPANDRKLASITLEGGVGSNDGTVTLVTRIDGVERRIPCAPGGWQRGCAAWGRLPEQPAAASGAWTAGDTFTAKLCFYETPFVVAVRLTFADGEVRCDAESNVWFGPTKEAELVGRAE